MQPAIDFLNILKKVKIFIHVPDEILRILSSKMIVKDYKDNESIFIKGDRGDFIYVILAGNVKLHEENMIIAEMGPGDFFGEFSLLDNEPRSLSVTSISDSKLAALHRDDFYKILQEHPDTTKDIMEALIKRIKDQNNKIFSYLKNREQLLEEEVSRKTTDLLQKNLALNETLSKLQQTQQQLVFKETLASLGQLTAGIAHTLKNPLNFINNFSLLSFDLVNEINQYANSKEQIELLEILKQNTEKVISHGKRANTIVENMLLHSTTGTGEKQNVNLNELTDEILGISLYYSKLNHPAFECTIQKKYASDLPSLQLSPKEISRIFLNILDNAFYALHEKVVSNPYTNKFEPCLEIVTRVDDKNILVEFKDNAGGIAPEVLDKIFEPFFTTKPSIHGNGLGLSMSNELIKMYGGAIEVVSEPDQGSTFKVVFPGSSTKI